MRIVVCYKCVPEEAEIVIRADRTLDTSKSQWKIGTYDLNAVEAGMQAMETMGGEVLALTAGDRAVDNSKMRKAILSRGPSKMCGVRDKRLENADSYLTATALKAGVDRIGNVDLVICGEGSGDLYAQQVGPLLGALLGWTTVNAVSKIVPMDGGLILERSLENSVEVLKADLPAVVSVTSDINIPRIPAMKDILSAGKKPFEQWDLVELGAQAESGSQTVEVLAPEETERLGIILEEGGAEDIDTLYRYLCKLI